jgi:F-type H+-transporting ATPase subunit gamma
MTDRLADVTARIDGIRQLGAVVNAMRGIAAARAQQARGQLTAVDSYAAVIAAGISQALTLAPHSSAPPHKAARRAIVLFCAEQGFAGAFSQRVIEGAGADLAQCSVFLVGTRGAAVAAERGAATAWRGAMPSHSTGIPKLADGLAEAIYARIAAGEIDALDVVFSQWEPGQAMRVERRCLFPMDMKAFPEPTDTAQPYVNLEPAALLDALTADYVHAQLCMAALHGFAAENEARMEAMAAARAQIERELTSLQATQRRVRQEAITAEIIELAAGETASQIVPRRKRLALDQSVDRPLARKADQTQSYGER